MNIYTTNILKVIRQYFLQNIKFKIWYEGMLKMYEDSLV